jgi:hypothetical protein
MRLLKAGILFLLMLPAWGLAQVSGSVESIGFASYFRPDCWTPMVVKVTPETGKSDTYQLRVKLQDLDRDLAIYQRIITVTGAIEGQNSTQSFRMYFIPPPTDRGLPDAGDAGSLRELQDRLKVSIYTNPSGATAKAKWICDLPITGAIRNVDPPVEAYTPRRGSKLVVAVTDGASRPILEDPSSGEYLGLTEDVKMVTIQPRELPENVLGYDAVDAIVWLDADPALLKASGGDEKFRALEQYVRRGGRLVICQPADWQKTLGFENLLPVSQIIDVAEKDDLFPLRDLAKPYMGVTDPAYANENDIPEELKDPFAIVQGPYRFARAIPKPDAVVEYWITWPAIPGQDELPKTPYLVREPMGLGSVTWVAQNLGDQTLTTTRRGWINVWNRVLGWNNRPMPVTSLTDLRIRQRFAIDGSTSTVDVGPALIGSRMELSSKSAWLITLAVLFFLCYWLLAGPGAYAYLAARKRTQLSWFVFGACAFGATALTYAMYRLVLRGPPEVRHFSVVRIAQDQPAVVISRFGLYIPRDGNQKIELKDVAPQNVTCIEALPIHPAFLKDVPAETGTEYTVPVVDNTSTEPAHLTFDYRSTLKKFQATWVGDLKGGITGTARLIPTRWIEGHLTNGLDQPLRNIYIAFSHPGDERGATAGEWILYVPNWGPGVTLDLQKAFDDPNSDSQLGRLPPQFSEGGPDGVHRFRGTIASSWRDWFLRDMKTSMSDVVDDRNASKALILLSFWDRLAPKPAQQGAMSAFSRGGMMQGGRLDLVRRGARMLDLSQSLTAGALVILAEADGPMPFPLDVEGERVSGTGTDFYQFVLPLDRSPLSVPATQPATQPDAN